MSKHRLFYHAVPEGILVDKCFRHRDLDRPIDRKAAIQRLMVLNGLTGKQSRDLIRFQEAHAKQQSTKEGVPNE